MQRNTDYSAVIRANVSLICSFCSPTATSCSHFPSEKGSTQKLAACTTYMPVRVPNLFGCFAVYVYKKKTTLGLCLSPCPMNVCEEGARVKGCTGNNKGEETQPPFPPAGQRRITPTPQRSWWRVIDGKKTQDMNSNRISWLYPCACQKLQPPKPFWNPMQRHPSSPTVITAALQRSFSGWFSDHKGLFPTNHSQRFII